MVKTSTSAKDVTNWWQQKMSILQAPTVLVIQLKRFEGLFGGKINISIAFEEFLVLWSFMCKTSQDRRLEYKLLVLLCILVSHPILVIIMHILRMQWVVGIAAMIRLSRFQLCKMSCLKWFTSFSSVVATKGQLILLQMGPHSEDMLIMFVARLIHSCEFLAQYILGFSLI